MAGRFVRHPAEHEFLLELRFAEPLLEELIPGLRRLGHRLFEELMSRGIGLSEIRSGIAPGRGAVAVRGLPEREPDKEKLRVGPLVKEGLRDGRPTPELIAFAQSERRLVKDLDRIYTERGHRFAAATVLPGRLVGEAVAELLADILGELRAARRGPGLPEIAALLAVSAGRPVPFEAQGLLAGGLTVADEQAFAPASVDEYFSELPRRGVPLESLGELQERLRRGRSLERN